uniref:Homologous recombination OB-fold protein OB-fold domain-containing protein n=1 Tax=Tanacetum cinerariifolium TaxID=118510 RepID=A0A6L2KAS0_TANCI|nr:hypothetical protein [Tanacetum cinerariifolium]
MACSIPHSDDEIQALVQKQIDEYMVHQKAILDLALQFDNVCTTKEDLRKAYEKCDHIPQEGRALIDTFLKEPAALGQLTTNYRKSAQLTKSSERAGVRIRAPACATNYVNAFGGTVTGCLGDIDNFFKKRKLEQVVAIVKSCSPNALGDLNVTLKDLSGAAMILANVLVFTPKPSKHYINITKRNVVEVFRKDTVFTPKPSKHYINLTKRNVVEQKKCMFQGLKGRFSNALIASSPSRASDFGHALPLMSGICFVGSSTPASSSPRSTWLCQVKSAPLAHVRSLLMEDKELVYRSCYSVLMVKSFE